jgi:hypothetical protein
MPVCALSVFSRTAQSLELNLTDWICFAAERSVHVFVLEAKAWMGYCSADLRSAEAACNDGLALATRIFGAAHLRTAPFW